MSGRRVLSRLFVFAVIGAAATVLVAWVCHLGPNLPLPNSVSDPTWPTAVPVDWPSEPKRHIWGRNALRRVDSIYTYEPPRPTRSSEVWEYRRERSGWPLRAMKVQCFHAISNTRADVFADGLKMPRRLAAGRPVPYFPMTPLWPGFAVDTAFYVGLAFVVWSAPGFVRRRVRRRRGRCVRCGYDLKGLPLCPECGS